MARNVTSTSGVTFLSSLSSFSFAASPESIDRTNVSEVQSRRAATRCRDSVDGSCCSRGDAVSGKRRLVYFLGSDVLCLRCNKFFYRDDLTNSSHCLLQLQRLRAKLREDEQRGILTDTFGRRHTYLRISLTERCNLRCESSSKSYKVLREFSCLKI